MRKFLSYIKSKTALFYDLNPAFLIATGLIFGILFKITNTITLIYIIAIAILIAFSLLFTNIKFCIKFLSATIAGFLLFIFFNTHANNSYLLLVPEHKNCGALITARITDTTATGITVPWLPNPKYLKAEILSFQYSPKGKIHPAAGHIVLTLPYSSSFSAEYGELIQSRGVFIVPDSNKYAHLFSFKEYLASLGIKHIFKIKTIKKIKTPPYKMNFYTKTYTNILFQLLKFRNQILKNLTDKMSRKYKRIFASLFFGCKQGLSYDSKQEYMKSGVIHIFAISGLHVGMLALNLFILFFFLPYKIRYSIVCSILFLYILVTGMQPSAIRAFLMILIWSIHRIHLRNISPLNTLFIAASISLIFNPMNIYSVGFHYSFTVTTFLLISWKSAQEYLKYINAELKLIPSLSTRTLLLHNIRNKTISTIHTAGVCWLSSSGMNALHGNLFIPGAVIYNLLILPFVWLLFCVASLNFFISFFSHLLAPVQEIILKIISALAEFGTHFSTAFYMGKVPIFLIIIYFTALIFLINAKSFKIFTTAVTILVITVSIVISARTLRKNQAVIINGNGNCPESLVALPAINAGNTVINVGSYQKSKSISSVLQNQGVNSIDSLIISNTKSNTLKGASGLFLKFNIRELVIQKTERFSFFMNKILKSAHSQHTEISFLKNNNQYSSPIIKFKTSKARHFLQLDIPQFHLDFLSEKKENSPTTIYIKLNNQSNTFSLKNSLNIIQKEITPR